MKWRITPSAIEGSLTLPGDKSIAHRALLLAALAPGQSAICNLPTGADVLATATCLRSLGVAVQIECDEATVTSAGSLAAPERHLDAANSGTTARLLAGILAGQSFPSRLTGDRSLCRRPMGRVIEPLTRMGAMIRASEGRVPLDIEPASLRGIEYVLPVPSAQVKSAILLAGLHASGETAVIETVATRDHTERMLQACGAHVCVTDAPTSAFAGRVVTPKRIALRSAGALRPVQATIPGDLSSAAFFLAAAVLGHRQLEVRAVSTNPTRTGFLGALRRMGVNVEERNGRQEMNEPVADVRIQGVPLLPLTIEAADVPLVIDEIPLLALLATQAEGKSEIRGAAELRVKESDRIATVGAALRAMGADLDELPDGFSIRGPTALRGAVIDSHGDHRLAMLGAVAGTIARGETVVDRAEAAGVSFPGFAQTFRSLGGALHE